MLNLHNFAFLNQEAGQLVGIDDLLVGELLVLVHEDLVSGVDVSHDGLAGVGSHLTIANAESLEALLEDRDVEVSRLDVRVGFLVEATLLLDPLDGLALLLFCLARGSFLLGSFLGSQFLFFPVREVTFAVQVVLGQSEESQRGQQEISLCLDTADELAVVGGMLGEELRGLAQSVLADPGVDHAQELVLVELLESLIILEQLLDLLKNLLLAVHQVLLKTDPLGNDVAADGLFLHLLEEVDPLLLGCDLSLPSDVLPPLDNGVHELWLEQVVVLLKLKALMQKAGIDIVGQSHESDCLVLHLRDQGPVLVVLRRDELRQKVLSVGLGDRLRLIVEDVSQIIVILLLGCADLDERHQVHPGREVHLGIDIDSSQVLHRLGVLALDLLEQRLHGVEAVVDVIFVSVALCNIQISNYVKPAKNKIKMKLLEI